MDPSIWEKGKLSLMDQRLLSTRVEYVKCTDWRFYLHSCGPETCGEDV